MPTFEPSPDLDPAVAQAIKQAMDSVRADILDQVAPTGDSGGSGRQSLRVLEEAVNRLDRASGQGELLETLLEEAGRFSDRAIFLVRKDEALTGWAAYGFHADSDAVGSLSLSGEPWATTLAGRPTELDANACDQVSAALGGSPATGGHLVPFSLRGEVAGALYGDGEADDAALRLLSYIASQALETLPLRRDATTTSSAHAAPPPVSAPSPAEEIAAATTEAEVEEAVDDVLTRIQDVDAEVGEGGDDDLLSIHHEVAPETFGSVLDDFTQVETSGLDQVVTEEIEDIKREDAAPDADFATEEISTAGALVTEAPPVEEGEETAEIDEFEETRQVEETGQIEDSGERAVEQGEIAPPSDLDGPGWAFGGDVETTESEDSQYEEARRLARLLVTEIKLYNEEKVRAGREQGNLYQSLREDIERSERIYQERIDDEVRSGTDYFKEELVRILAGGDSTVLGD